MARKAFRFLDYCHPSPQLPPFSGSKRDVDAFARRGGIVPRNGGGFWGPTAVNLATCPAELMQIRLARAWERRALRFWKELYTRVKCIVFLDCPAAVDLGVEGVGWGIFTMSENCDGDNVKLYRSSVNQSEAPDMVLSVRKWFACVCPVSSII